MVESRSARHHETQWPVETIGPVEEGLSRTRGSAVLDHRETGEAGRDRIGGMVGRGVRTLHGMISTVRRRMGRVRPCEGWTGWREFDGLGTGIPWGLGVQLRNSLTKDLNQGGAQ